MFFLLQWLVAVCIIVPSALLALARRISKSRTTPKLIGFFHPFTNDGGGGERVLWCAVRAVQELDPDAPCCIYTGDSATPESLQERAKRLFGVELRHAVEVVKVNYRSLVEAKTYPRFTLIGQSLGSIILTAEAVLRRPPALFFDTAGYAFGYGVVTALVGCPVACYTHYPTISGDMLGRVKSRTAMYNNDAAVASSSLLSFAKLLYYRAFAFLYCLAGSYATTVMVNSSWTEAHIRSIWTRTPAAAIHRVYPPCNTAALQELPLKRSTNEKPYIISLAQFRPEKNHALQLWSFASAINPTKKPTDMLLQGQQHQEEKEEEKREAQDGAPAVMPGGGSRSAGRDCMEGVRLKLVGSSRHREDEERIELLSCLAVQLGVSHRVDFIVNAPYSDVQQLLGGATCGLHSMVDEHFGISVVEYMAAGAIPIAHASAGPLMDIVRPAVNLSLANEDHGAANDGGEQPQLSTEVSEDDKAPVGFLAKKDAEYAAAMRRVFGMDMKERESMAEEARKKAKKFSEERFDSDFKSAIQSVMTSL